MDQQKIEQKIFNSYKLIKHQTQNPSQREFHRHQRHYFILTKYGKPIFSRYGDEIGCSSLLASLSTIIEKYQLSYQSKLKHMEDEEHSDQNESDHGSMMNPQINYIRNDRQLIVILNRSQIIYVVISQNPSDSYYKLHNSLDLLHILVLSLITKYSVFIMIPKTSDYQIRK